MKKLSMKDDKRGVANASSTLVAMRRTSRLKSDSSREVRRIATSVLLALATPRLSSFMLSFFIGPYYERENRSELAVAAYEEALKWTSDAAERRDLEEKIRALR